MEIIKKINVNGCVNFYKLHRANEHDVLFYLKNFFTEGETLWKFYNPGWMDDKEADLNLQDNRRINGADFYLKFKVEDLGEV